ncbi:hypothetical protein [Streptomyces sp. NPDC057257]|uniref:hypothetical protein n=1 Tax=Streptomyces sp. NPDC057257 TaxID=3346071 RepID=UPI0036334BA3
MTTVTNKAEAPSVDCPSIDAELIADNTDAALRMELGTSTREDIDTRTTTLVEQLNLLLCEELGADEDPAVRDLFRRGYRLLDTSNRPTQQTAAFNAFFYMRDVAGVARRLLWIYTELSHHAT